MFRQALALGGMSCALAGCSLSAETAPPAAADKIEPTLVGLAGLFREECLRQRSANWARERYQRARAACWGDNDCEARLPDEARWNGRTTDNQPFAVTYYWDWNGPGATERPLTCSVSVPPKLAQVLRAVAVGVRFKQRAFEGRTSLWIPGANGWQWTAPGPERVRPTVALLRHTLPEELDRKLGLSGNSAEIAGSNVQNHRYMLEANAAYPWELRYKPDDRNP